MNQKKQTCGFIRIDICYFWDRFFLLLARATLRTSVRSRYSVASCGSGVDRGVPNAGTWSLVVRPGGAAGVPPLSGGETPARDRVHIFRLFREVRKSLIKNEKVLLKKLPRIRQKIKPYKETGKALLKKTFQAAAREARRGKK